MTCDTSHKVELPPPATPCTLRNGNQHHNQTLYMKHIRHDGQLSSCSSSWDKQYICGEPQEDYPRTNPMKELE